MNTFKMHYEDKGGDRVEVESSYLRIRSGANEITIQLDKDGSFRISPPLAGSMNIVCGNSLNVTVIR